AGHRVADGVSASSRGMGRGAGDGPARRQPADHGRPVRPRRPRHPRHRHPVVPDLTMTQPTRRTFRPIGVIVVMWAAVVVLAVLALVIGLRLPEEYRFTTSQTVTIWVLIGFVALFAAMISRRRVTADEEALTFSTGWRSRTLR